MKYLITVYFLLVIWVGKGQEIMANVDVGDIIPPIVLTGIQNHPTGTLDLVKASREKLVILDFWATWCGACLAGMPKLDTLMQEFNKELEVILVTKEARGYVDQVFKKRRELGSYIPQLPIFYGDTVLNSFFLHNTIPTYVWLKDGKVIGITEEVTKDALRMVLDEGQINLRKKVYRHYRRYDRSSSSMLDYLYDGHRAYNNLIKYYSFWTEYIDRLGPTGGYYYEMDELGNFVRFTGNNMALENIYFTAWGNASTFINDAKIEIRSSNPYFVPKDLKPGMEAEEWIKKHTVNYEVTVEPGNNLFEKMRSDLREAFPEIHAELIPTQDTCLVLEVFDNYPEKDWKVKEGDSAQVSVNDDRTLDADLLSLLIKFEYLVFYRSKYPIVERTGYSGKINIELNGIMQSVEDVNRALEPYGLRLEKKIATYDRLVISDNLPHAK